MSSFIKDCTRVTQSSLYIGTLLLTLRVDDGRRMSHICTESDTTGGTGTERVIVSARPLTLAPCAKMETFLLRFCGCSLDGGAQTGDNKGLTPVSITGI